jgi:hypothetical protein
MTKLPTFAKALPGFASWRIWSALHRDLRWFVYRYMFSALVKNLHWGPAHMARREGSMADYPGF